MAAISSKYIKLDAKQHVLARPGMYIGSIEEDTYDTWVFDLESQKMVKRQIKYIPGFFKVFDEILVNAIDHSIRIKRAKEEGKATNLLKNIKVSVNPESGIFEVFNDGDGIEIVKHPEHGIYIPELIFGNMLTSTNYDDTEEKTIGGQNGIGAKATSVFSKFFEVETVDCERKLHYIQRFEENMTITNTPVITKYTKKPFTIVRFQPDYLKFSMKNGITSDMLALITKRIYDACAITDNDVNIYLNDQKLDFKNFEKYVDLFLGQKSEHGRVYEKINDRWEVVASYNDYNGFDQVSFVNGIWTIRGGKHVEYILNQIVKKLTEMINKKHKNITIKPQTIKDNIILFLKSTIVNPSFDSQSKETLTTPSSKFGSKAEVSDKFIEKLYKTGIVDKVLQISQITEVKSMQKSDGKKRNVIKGIPKLEDANWAGTGKSKDCVLILTEGDTAASMAIGGLSEVGRDKYGVFPLKGKLINVKDTNVKKIAENEELNNIKKILGLEASKDYDDVSDLRYGSLMIMCDQDHDGSHIKGLLFNLFHTLWPSLLKNNIFVTSLLTPIVKARNTNLVVQFYSLTDYENWYKEHSNERGWTIKYYKGLGTSDKVEAREYFKEMKRVKYIWNDDPSDSAIDLAFNKKKADNRKSWLATYDKQNILDYSKREVTYDEFVDKDLIHFSNYDLERSIPNMVDGLKISQRKILYCCFKRNLTDKEIKVAQLAAYVSEHSAYHHGEASLQSTIIGIAQNFVGSNNINLLMPNGMFGTRIHGGKDAGQPRYIFTLMSKLCTAIFMKEDMHILKYLLDDDTQIEPEHYVPIIPMILVNGALGIGTGFSTTIPCHNPSDIISILLRLLDGEEIDTSTTALVPWYAGFNGTIEEVNGKLFSRGKYHKTTATKIEVTELPIGTWTFDFKCMLEELLDKNPDIKGYENNSGDDTVKFSVQFTNGAKLEEYMQVQPNGFTKVENELKLVTSKPLSTTNMYAFNSRGVITKYDTAVDIIIDFFGVRLVYYQKRKDYLIGKIKYDLDLLANKIRFIKAVVEGDIVPQKMRKVELEDRLGVDGYMKHEDSFDYIIRIPVYNLTIDKVEELENEYKKHEDEFKEVLNKTPQQMWKDELLVLRKLWEENQKPLGGKKKLKST